MIFHLGNLYEGNYYFIGVVVKRKQVQKGISDFDGSSGTIWCPLSNNKLVDSYLLLRESDLVGVTYRRQRKAGDFR